MAGADAIHAPVLRAGNNGRSRAAAHGDQALAAAGLRAYSPIRVRTNRAGLPKK